MVITHRLDELVSPAWDCQDVTSLLCGVPVPTVSDTVIETVEVNGKPKTITQTRTVGKVKVGAAFDLTLEFVVTNPKGTLASTSEACPFQPSQVKAS